MKCKICQTEFETKRSFYNHLRTHKITYKNYYIKYIIDSIPLCICGKECKWNNNTGQFKATCGEKECIKKSISKNNAMNKNEHRKKISKKWKSKNKNEIKKIVDKRKQTNIEKYGTYSYNKTNEYKEKLKQTCLEKYGKNHYTQTTEYKEKMKMYWKKKFGTLPFQSEKIKEKIKQTNLEKYGVENPFQSEKIKEKLKKHYLEKYGVENPFQSEKIKEKIKKTNLEKYGVEYYSQTGDYKEKMKQTNLEKYGVENYSQTDECKEKIKQTNIEKYGIESYFQTNEFKEKAHNTKKKNKSYGKSKIEDEVFLYIKENIDENVKRQVFIEKWNIDFYLPKYDLYVQFDGDYWHGYLNTKEELSKTQQGKHIIKMMEHDKEQNKTISNLIRIRESEWKKDKNIINEKIKRGEK